MPTTEQPKTFDINVRFEVPVGRIQDLLCCAFEGGSNYWYNITEFVEPPKMPYKTDSKQVYKHLDYPVNTGGGLYIMDDRDGEPTLKEPFFLNLSTLLEGLRKMAIDQPAHFSDFINENEDATTGDVYLQYCVFGKLVYG